MLVFIVEQNLVKISAVMLVVFYCQSRIHMTRHRAIMYNITSSTKPAPYLLHHHATEYGSRCTLIILYQRIANSIENSYSMVQNA